MIFKRSLKPLISKGIGTLVEVLRGGDHAFYIYLLARVIKTLAGIYLIRVLVTLLSVIEYGEWKYLEVMSAMCVPILTLSLPAAMMRMFYDQHEDNERARRQLISTVWRLSWMASLSLMVFCLTLGGPLLGFSIEARLFFGLVTPGAILISFFNYLTRIQLDSRLYLINRVMESVGFVILLTFGAMLSSDEATSLLSAPLPALQWVILSWAFCLWSVIVVDWIYYRRREVLQRGLSLLEWPKIKALLRFSAPLSGTYFLGWLLNSLDIYLLKREGQMEQVAFYAFAVGFASFVGLITQAALTDWAPFFYATQRDDSKSRAEAQALIINRARLYLSLHIVAIGLIRLISAFGYELFNAKSYTPGLPFIGILALGNFFFLVGNLSAIGVGYAKKTHLTLITFMVPGALNLGLNLHYIPLQGAFAAAWTTAVSFGVFALLSYAVSRTYYQFDKEGSLLVLLLLGTCVGLSSW